MRTLMIVLTAVVPLLVTSWAEATSVRDPGEVWIKHKHPNEGKDYYIVRKGDSNHCSIVEGKFGNKPAGAVGDAPYASMEYARRALKSSPECKGGLVEDTDQKQEN